MEKVNKSRLDEFIQRPKRAIWIIAGPMMFGFIVHALYLIIDTFFIGRLGPESLAAITFAMPFVLFTFAIVNGLVIGVTAAVAQAIGRREKDTADHLASNALGIGLILGFLLAAIGILAGRFLMPLLGAQGNGCAFGVNYVQVISAGMPFFFISAAMRAVFIGEGDAKTPTVMITISIIINLVLDPILIFHFGLGVVGAALATVIAVAFTCIVYSYIAFFKHRLYVRFKVRLMMPRWHLIKLISTIGLPPTVNQIINALGIGMITRVLAEFGQTAVAGFGAAGKVDMIVIMLLLGLAGASVTVIGMFAGAGLTKLVRSITLYTIQITIIFAIIIGTIVYMASECIMGFFTSDVHTLSVGSTYLRYIVFTYPLIAFIMTTVRVLQGLGYGMPSFIMTVLRVVVISVPSSYIAVFLFHTPIQVVWLSIIGAACITGILAFWWIRAFVWKRDPSARAQQSLSR